MQGMWPKVLGSGNFPNTGNTRGYALMLCKLFQSVCMGTITNSRYHRNIAEMFSFETWLSSLLTIVVSKITDIYVEVEYNLLTLCLSIPVKTHVSRWRCQEGIR